jgi:hypothetical protein
MPRYGTRWWTSGRILRKSLRLVRNAALIAMTIVIPTQNRILGRVVVQGN